MNNHSWLRRLFSARPEKQSVSQPVIPPDTGASLNKKEVSEQGASMDHHSSPVVTSSAPAEAQAAVSAAWQVGDVLLDQYEVTGKLGEGGMGTVYKVHHRGWNIDLAVKSPRPEIFARAGGNENFIREAETWVNLQLHPHTVTCYYVRTLGGIPRVFAEYVAGGSLADWIGNHRLYQGGHKLALERILDIAIQFAWGLHAAHEQGLIHQDIKPANVMLAPEGTAKVTDFGLAKARSMAGEQSGKDRSRQQSILVSSRGMTPAYCSPEQAAGQALSRKTDIWSWGVSLLEMFVGSVTWMSGIMAREVLTSHEVQDAAIPPMPGEIVRLLARCFQLRPEERPATMLEVAETLLEIYRGEMGYPHPREVPQTAKMLAASLNNRALSLYDLEKREEAKQVWEQAREADPQHLETTYNQGVILWRRGELTDEKLVYQLERLREGGQGQRWQTAYLMAQVHLERGDVDAALPLLEEAAQQAPGEREVEALLKQARAEKSTFSRCLCTSQGHTGKVTSVSLSADGSLAVSGSDGQNITLSTGVPTVALWETTTGSCLGTLHEGHIDLVTSVSLSADGRFAASGSSDKTVRLWETTTGRYLHTLRGHTDRVTSVGLSADGRLAVSGSRDQTVRLWETTTGRCLHTLRDHIGLVSSVSLSADGRFAISGGGYTVRLWETATERCLRTLQGHTDIVGSVSLSADGRLAVSGSRDKTVRLWETTTGRCLRAFQGHTEGVTSVSLSADGNLAVSGGDPTVRLWETATGRCLRTFQGHTDSVTSVSLSTDGRFVVSGSYDMTVRLWETATGRCLHTLQGHTGVVQSVCLSGNGSFAISGSDDGFGGGVDKTVRLWETATGRCLRTLHEGHTDLVTSVSLSADGRFAASGSDDKTVRLWEIATRSCLRTLQGHTGKVTSVSLSADGRWAASSSLDDTIRLWETATGRCLRTLQGHTGKVISVSLSADGSFVVSGSYDKTVRLWETATGRCLHTLQGHTGVVQSVSLSGDGRFAISGSDDKIVRLWETTTGCCLRTLQGHTYQVTSVGLSGDGRFAISGSGDMTMRLWETATGRCLRTFQGHTAWVTSASLSHDGRFAISGDHNGTVQLWEIGNFHHSYCSLIPSHVLSYTDVARTEARAEKLLKPVEQARTEARYRTALELLREVRALPGWERNPRSLEEWSRLSCYCSRVGLRAGWPVRIIQGHTGEVSSVSLSADGNFAISGSGDKTVRLWEISTGRCLRTFQGHTALVTSVSLSADGSLAVSGSVDQTARLWETATGRCLHTFQGHTDSVNSVSLSADGSLVVSAGGDDLTVRLWETATGRCLRTFQGHIAWVASVSLSADGRFVISVGKDCIMLWETATGHCLCTLQGYKWAATSVSLSADGNFVISGNHDKTVQLWEMTTRQCVRNFQGHTAWVTSVSLSDDGRFAVSGSYDRTVQLWETATGRCLHTLQGHTDSVTSVSLSTDGRWAASGSKDHTVQLWELDWELEAHETADWDEGARPYLELFLTQHTPYAGQLPQNRNPTEQEIQQALTRRGTPTWNEPAFQTLIRQLQYVGYGWLRPEGVRRQLEQMKKEWKGPPPIPGEN